MKDKSELPQIRFNEITKEWVIFSKARAKRPSDFVQEEKMPQLPDYDPKCPFCPGGAASKDPTLLAIEDLRIVPNKFPALVSYGESKLIETNERKKYIAGFGYHEVVIETSKHNWLMGYSSVEEISKVIKAWKERFIQLRADKRVKAIVIFRNFGPKAGPSLVHPHSQIIATPVVPTMLRILWNAAMNYYDENMCCAFCRLIEEEKAAKIRVVMENKDFIAICPYASELPMQITIYPIEHQPSFAMLKEESIPYLADMLNKLLHAFHKAFGYPSYNLVIRTPPMDEEDEFAHWHLEILPRLTSFAGFELGSGMHINPVFPEEAAAFIKSHF